MLKKELERLESENNMLIEAFLESKREEGLKKTCGKMINDFVVFLNSFKDELDKE